MKKNLLLALMLGAFLDQMSYANPPGGNVATGSTPGRTQAAKLTAENVAAVQPSLRNTPPGRNLPGIGTPANSRSISAGQVELPNTNDRHLGLGNPAIGGPTTPGKALPALTGVVNPAKNTAAVNGSDMKRKP